jgi:16S rRNA (adenine1518-N6/adenine1519-N6)-dimethyltransferase
LAKVLKTGLLAKEIKNVEVINEDILKFSPANYKLQNYKIVANLPYNITSIFLRKFLESEKKPEFMTLMLQKEVAERICAQPGKMSLLSVSVQFYAKPEIIQIVPKEDFWPSPEVDSAIIKIISHPKLLLNKEKEEKDFFRLVKFGFSAKRKMLKNNLAAGFKIDQTEVENKIVKAGLNSKIRAQELLINDWLKLLDNFS